MAIIEKPTRYNTPADSGNSSLSFIVKGVLAPIVDIPSSVIVSSGNALDATTDFIVPDSPAGTKGIVKTTSDVSYGVSVVDNVILFHEAVWKGTTITQLHANLYSYSIGNIIEQENDNRDPLFGLEDSQLGYNKQVIRTDDTVNAVADVTAVWETAEIPMDGQFVDVVKGTSTTDFNQEKHFIKLLKITLANPIVHTAFTLEPSGARPFMHLVNRGTISNNTFHVVVF